MVRAGWIRGRPQDSIIGSGVQQAGYRYGGLRSITEICPNMIGGRQNKIKRHSRVASLVQSLTALLVVVVFAGPAGAQRKQTQPSPTPQPQPQSQINAAVFLFTPFAIEQYGSLDGFSI